MKDIYGYEEIEEVFDEDSMPVPCEHCGHWFDLLDGSGSDKWHPGIVICPGCHEEEEKEIETDEEIADLKDDLLNARDTVNSCESRLKELGINIYEL